MAEIELRILAKTPADYYETLRGLAYPAVREMTIEDALMHAPRDFSAEEEAMADQPRAAATEDAEPGEQSRRFKRTREEMARGLTVEQAKAERANGGSQSAATSSPTSSRQTLNESAPERSETEDPFAPSPPTSSGSQASGASEAATLSQVRDAMSFYLSKDGNDAAKMLTVMGQFKAEDGSPVERISTLQLKDYAAAIEALRA